MITTPTTNVNPVVPPTTKPPITPGGSTTATTPPPVYTYGQDVIVNGKNVGQAKFDAKTGAPLQASTTSTSSTTGGSSTSGTQSSSTDNTGTTSGNPPITTPTPVTTAPLADQSDRDKLAADQAVQQQAAQTFSDSVTGIMNGTIPLSPGDQAQVQALQQQFDQLIQQQQTTNTGASGTANVRGYQTGAGEYDPTFQTKTISSIVSAGAQKVTNLQVQEAGAVAQLTDALKNNEIAGIKEAYDALDTAHKETQAALQKTIDDTTQAIKDAQAAQQKVTDAVNALAEEAQKNGADSKTVNSILTAGSVAQALNVAGDSLQTSSNPDIAKYLQYKKDTEAKGLVPIDYSTYQDQQDKKASQAKINEAYATENAKNQADANSTASDKVQQKLEQQYRGVLAKELSSRSGALGTENAKVDQANHLNALFTQYYDPKTGNYNIPKSQYAELAIGLANLVSGTGSASEGTIQSIMQATAKGDLNNAIAYATGIPQNGSTQDVFKNLIDSVDRQATTAVSNREAALQNMRDQAPTDLDQSRVDALNKSTEMVPYAGQDRVSESNINNFLNEHGNETIQTPDGEHSFWYLASEASKIPGSSPSSFEDWLKTNNYMQ